MKRLKMGVLLLISCLFLTACGCSREEFVITFDSNGGTSVASQTVKKGEKVIKPTDPTKEGFTFDGWYLDLAGDKYDFSKEVTSDLTLKAKWVEAVEDDKTCDLTCGEGYILDEENCKCVKEESKSELASIKLNKSTLTLIVGQSETVKLIVSPSDAEYGTITWKSSNTKVVTVSNGKITAVGTGTANVTATVDGKTATVKVTVISKDQANLNAALNSITAKTITTGNTGINYTYSGCTITNTANNASNETVVETGLVKTLYRGTSAGSISSTYKVTCGKLSDTKTVKHTIAASTYNYTSTYNGISYVISVAGAKNYVLSSSKASNLKYLEAAGGAQVGPLHEKGIEYKMVFNDDVNTIYAVKSAE